MNLKNYALVALILIGFTACKKIDSNKPDKQSAGEDTKISLSLSMATSGTKTYAGGDANASRTDVEMNTVDIFIFDNVSPFALTHKSFQDVSNKSADFETVDGARRLKNGIELDTKTGSKMIYVGVNLPASYVTQIKAKGLVSLDGLFDASLLYNGVYDGLYLEGMPMFSNEAKIITLEKTGLGGIPSANKVSFNLTRILAKVKLDGTSDFNSKVVNRLINADPLMPVSGGSIDISTIVYSLRQVNEKTYLKGNEVFDWKRDNYFYNRQTISTSFGSSRYAPENRAENDLTKLTYAVVAARFIPSVFEDGPGYSPGRTFYTVTDPSNGSVKYYIIDANAVDNTTSGKEFREYTNGICYYHIYLNPENDHKVVRNEYYNVEISNVRGIGKSSQNAAFLGFDDKLYNAELIDPATGGFNTRYSLNRQLAATNANIEATVTILPWTVVASEHEL